jgi:2-haloacid dehalogenase
VCCLPDDATEEGAMAPVCVFDVNETLLDLAGLDGQFERLFGDRGVRMAWFGQLLQSAMVATITDRYSDFGTVGRAALDMTAASAGVELSDDDRQAVAAAMSSLPAHREVAGALYRLTEGRVRMAALTNSTERVARAQLEQAGIVDHFTAVLSADAVRRLKPAPEPYRMAAERLGVEPGEVLLVAAHAWDVAGALRAGCRAAFVARPGKVLDPLVETPDLVVADLDELADRLLA